MSAITEASSWFELNVKGKKFRRKRGKIIYRAEALKVDTSYLRDYGFVNTSVKLYDTRNGKGLSVTRDDLTYDWIGAIDV